MAGRAVSSPGLDAATRKVLDGIENPELEARYPDRAHFIAADNPRHSEMATRALFSGDPVVLVYPDGREVLFTPERTLGLAGLFIFFAFLCLRIRSRVKADEQAVQMPPRTRIEARDSSGIPIAA